MHIFRSFARPLLAMFMLILLIIPALAAESEYTFTQSDFVGSSGIIITAVPSEQRGILRCGTRTIRSGDVLPAGMLDSLRFEAADTDTDTEAVIRYLPIQSSSLMTESTVQLHMLAKKANQPPIAIDSELETYKNIAHTGQLNASDPEGKALQYTLVSEPKRGSVKIEEDGSFTYTPAKNKVGRDSFRFIVTDAEGLTSDPATVSIRIKKPGEKESFADMENREGEYYAVWAREQGLLSGESVIGQLCFHPDTTVSRGEFVAMVMKLFDLQPAESSVHTDFADETTTQAWMQPYLTAAVSSGIISGIRSDEGLVFRADASITQAEAALILQNLLQFPTGVSRFPTAEVWAQQAVSALYDAGIETLTGSDECLTRLECVKLLYSAYHASDTGRYGLLAWAAE